MTKQREKKLKSYPQYLRNILEELIIKLIERKFDNLDIKEMKWERKGHYRCRKWSIRIIYEDVWGDIVIKKIDSRWDVYK